MLFRSVIASALLSLSLAGARRDALLAGLAEGKLILAPALHERRARYDLAHIETRARPQGAGFVLDGEKVAVMGGGVADGFLVPARLRAKAGEGVIALFHVPRETRGLTVLASRTLDNASIATLVLDGVALDADALIARAALPAIEQAADTGIAALCAEALGVLRATLDTTVDYLRVRKQFGQPLGKFQALRHACADMFVAVEEAASASLLAAFHCNDPDDRARRRAVSAAKVTVNKACRFVGQTAVQLHGGIAMTQEAAISHYFRRLAAIELTLGDTDHHLAAFVAAG